MTKTAKKPAADPAPDADETRNDDAPHALEVVHGISHLDSAQALPEVGADVECVPFEGPESQIHAFKGTDGRTMQVVVTDDGLAARELAD